MPGVGTAPASTTGVRVEPLQGTARWLGKRLGQTVPGQLYRAGLFPPG